MALSSTLNRLKDTPNGNYILSVQELTIKVTKN